MGHLITNALARPFLHLLISTPRPRWDFRDQLEPSPWSDHRSLTHSRERRWRWGAGAIPLVNLSVFILGCCLRDARFIAAPLCQHGPGDPRQLRLVDLEPKGSDDRLPERHIGREQLTEFFRI